MQDNLLILDKYIRVVCNTYLTNVRPTNIGYNFKCNVCNDSKTNKKKRRGWILKNKNPWIYYCHNCHSSMSVKNWLKLYFPSIFTDYLKELLISERRDVITPQIIIPEVKVEKKEINSEIVPILKGTGSLFESAIKLCKKRNIHDNIWTKWYVAVNGTYKNRLIIPFYDKDEKIYYFQARTLIDDSCKYINMEENRDEAIYNIHFINKDKPVVALEGVIDSLFIENSISLLSTRWSAVVQEQIDLLNIYYLLDNDKDGKNKMYKLLSEGKSVFLWKKFMRYYNLPKREKWDINDVCLYLQKEKFTFEELQQFFSSSLVQGVWI